jgi:hypothetical protein
MDRWNLVESGTMLRGVEFDTVATFLATGKDGVPGEIVTV